ALRLAAENRISEATDVLESYVENHPEHVQAHIELGRLQWSSGDYARAARSFEEALRSDPGNREAGVFAVLSLAQSNDEASRGRQVAILRTLADEASDEATWLLYALASGAARDSAGQVAALQQAATRGVTGPQLQEALGVALAMNGDLQQAEYELNQALDAQPGSGDVSALLGVVAQLRGDPAAARTRLEAALEGQTTLRPQVLTQLGLLLLNQGEFSEAARCLGEAAGLESAPPEALFFHAVCLQALGQNESAIKAFEAIARAQGPFAGRAALCAAQSYIEMNSLERATDALERATRGKGISEAEIETLQARIHVLEGDDAAARAALRRAISRDSSYAPARLESGLLYIRRQVLSEGVRELELYLSLVDPEDPSARALEVGALVEQLKQSQQSESAAAPAPAGPAAAGEQS
ncbi:MAG: tetratricopeptide repeat protein, partial [Candidatus Hydrogenedentes bacterium]|nr:tetratricopeptide repeat protein [Candidatus Hydrogenedentota bacterium]